MSARRPDLRDKPFLPASCELRVRFQEVDALQMVWHGHYLSYCEEGRNAFGRRYGFDYAHILEHGFVAPLVHVELDYQRPARFDQLLRVTARLHQTEGARMDFTYVIADAEDRPLASGASVQLFTNLQGEPSMTKPGFYDEFLQRWQQHFQRK